MKFKLIKEAYLDPEKKFYDFHTGDVKGNNIFDTHTTGMSFYNDLLPDSPEKDYMRDYKGLVGEIVQMTPNEYFNECAKVFSNNYSPEQLKQQRGQDKGTIEHLKEVILKYHKKFPMAMVSVDEHQQEGMHRMIVAGELFGWDTKFPVLVVRKV